MNVPAFRDQLAEHQAVAREVEALLPQVERVAELIRSRLAAGGRLLVFGNGGSAADAQHFAAELVGRTRRDRRPLGALALTTDPSVTTGIGNDFGPAEVFARQVSALARPADVVVGISTSGRSENVLRALRTARGIGAAAVAFTGADGLAAGTADHVVAIPSRTTARIQEMHILVIHLICERIDEWAAEVSPSSRPPS